MAGIQSESFVRFLRRAMVVVRIGLQCGKVKLLDEVVTIPAGVAGKGRGAGSGCGVVILFSLFQVMAETGNHHGGTTKTENTATADDK